MIATMTNIHHQWATCMKLNLKVSIHIAAGGVGIMSRVNTPKPMPQGMGEYLAYDAIEGKLTWIQKSAGSVAIGDLAGCVNNSGYLVTGFNGRLYRNHRIAWFLHTGEQPPDQIDHIDGDKLNNTFTNLRTATLGQNQHNQGRRKNNTSGYKGVSWKKKSGKWQATIVLHNKQHHLGYFDTPEEAYSAYCKAADELHKEFKNYGLIEV
jgi:hypothetical protein